jgi:cyclophilin family peptidyl-prolyl cis-trans isomerase
MSASKSALLETMSLGSSFCAPSFETLESRFLLSAPTFVTPLSQGYWVPVPTDSSAYNTRVIGIDGSSDTTGVTAAVQLNGDGSSVPGLTVSVQNSVTTDYADMHFVSSTGTVIGDIVFQLFDSQTAWTASDAAAQRFEGLATEAVSGGALVAGTPFYTNVVVHRVIPGFMIQTGDATKGDGTGSSGLGNLTDSFDPNLSFVGAGVVAMANTGSANSSDCQFFITDAPTSWLNGSYMIIGQVVSGWNVLNQIINMPADSSTNRPTNPPIMQSVTIFQTVSAATVTLTTDATFTSSANVTITLTNGDGETTQDTIEVVPESQMPTLITNSSIPDQKIAPGTTGTAQAQFTLDPSMNGLTMTYSAASSQSSATVSIDSSTQVVTVTVPSTFSGILPVQVTATATGEGGFWADPLPVSFAFDVISQNANDPPLESHTLDASGGQVYMTVPYDNYLLVAAGTSGVLVYDVSNPASPTEVGSFATGGTAQDIAISGTTAFVADGSGGVVALNITDPTNIQLDSTVATTSAATNIAIDPTQELAYVADGATGLLEVDISTPTVSMTVKKTVLNLSSYFSVTDISDVVLNGHYAYVAMVVSVPNGTSSDTDGAVEILDISTPANPVLANVFATVGSPNEGGALDVVGNTLYVANYFLITYNLTNPYTLTMGERLTPSSASGYFDQVSVVNGMAMVGSSTALTIIDATNPAKMVVQYTFAGSGMIGDSSAVGDNLAVAGGPDGLLLFQGIRTLTNQSITFHDANNVLVTLTIANGSANILFTGYNGGNITSLTFITSSPTTTLTITTPAGKFTTVGDITDSVGSLNSLVARTTDVTGDITVLGSLATLTIYDMNGASQQTITVSDNSSVTLKKNASLAVTMHNVSDALFSSLLPISTLTVNSWLGTGGDDYIHAPSIGTLTVNGNLEAAIQLDNSTSVAKTLGTAKVAGSITGYDWDIAGNVGTVTVGNVSNWTIGEYNNGLGTITPLGSIAGLTAGTVANTTIDATGYLGAIKAVSWIGGSITATGTTSVTTTGGDLSTNITLDGAGVASTAKTLGLVKSAGIFDGTWTVTGATGALTASSIPATWNGTFSGSVSSLTVSQNAYGKLQAAGITGSMSIKGNYGDGVNGDTTLNLTQPLNGTKVALGSLTVSGWIDNVAVTSLANLGAITATGGVSGTTINSTGYLGAIKALSWTGGSITATGTAGVTTTAGDLSTDMTLSGVGVAGTAKTLGLVTSAGIFNGTWNVTGNTGALTASSIPATWDGAFSGSIASLAVSHNAYGHLQAAGITGIASIKGNYGDGVGGDTTLNLTQPLNGPKSALGSMTVGGTMNDVTVTSLANLGAITATGAVAGTTINSTGYLGAIKALSWTGGSITATGTAGITATGGDVNTDVTLSGAGVLATAKTLGLVKSAGAIDGTWSVTGATGAMTAVSIPTTWNGTFSGNILSMIVSQNAYGQLKAGSITTMTVKGNYGDGVGGDTTLKLTQPLDSKTALGTLNVTGWMSDVDVTSLDSLGAITAGGMTGSNVYAGVLNVDDTLTPMETLDHTVMSHAGIASVTIKGITGAAASYVNTDLAAWNMGTLKLNQLQAANAGTAFGVAADTIKSYTAQIGAKPYTWTPTAGVWPSDTSAPNGDYECLYVV